MNLLWRFASWFSGIPVEQLKCRHPAHAREDRLTLLPEEEAFDFYEVCLNCGKEWHEKRA